MPTSKKSDEMCAFSLTNRLLFVRKNVDITYTTSLVVIMPAEQQLHEVGGLGESREEVKFHSAISLAEFLWLLVWNSLLLMKLWFPVELYTTYVPELFLRC